VTGVSALEAADPPGAPTAYSVSWNLTQRCNLRCDHCYISAGPGPRRPDELSTTECRRVMDEIAEINPNILLILTGGEPLLRPDLPELAAAGRERGFTVVVGTNGVLLRERQARLLRESGVQGVSLSLDSTDPARHDAFRRLPGAWQGAMRATEACRAEGLGFSLHMSVTEWNADEIPAMIDLARERGATVLNLFFLVRCGRAEGLTDIPPEQYERILTALARTQGSRADGLLVRAKCAPQFRRIVWEMDPTSPLLQAYAEGSCPAGKHYCRITPEGDVTPSPYMPVAVGSLRERSFADLWRSAPVFRALRTGRLRGRCGECEFSKICGGCRCRAYATSGDYLAEDPACSYQPGAHGGKAIEVPAALTFGLEVSKELAWSEAASARLQAIPSFARGMVVKAVETYARSGGHPVVTPEVMAEVRQSWGARFAQGSRL
jgi:radical SAM protein with 4Fe4S-binding SPASM domain